MSTNTAPVSSITKNRLESSLVHVVREECGKVVTIIFPEATELAKIEIERAQKAGKLVSWEKMSHQLYGELAMVG